MRRPRNPVEEGMFLGALADAAREAGCSVHVRVKLADGVGVVPTELERRIRAQAWEVVDRVIADQG